VSEHHFHEANFVGSVAPYAAAMVQATSRIKVGLGLALAPLHDPIRMAEDAAFLDVLSGGRFELGLGIGYRDIEYEGFGGHRKQRVGRTVELIEICRQAWGGDRSSTRPLLPAPRHRRHPKPVQPGGPPIMMGGHHPNALDRCARLGDRFCMDAGTDSESYEEGQGRNRDVFDRVASAVRLYREALERHGKDTDAPELLAERRWLPAPRRPRRRLGDPGGGLPDDPAGLRRLVRPRSRRLRRLVPGPADA
jgi:alkanesulfonate monooxygenase SsuD/methylene tetrahydromethanopterin reductase-like flavin-dependent oxidoreductase (luciferase family)